MNQDTLTILIADDEALARDSIKILVEQAVDCQITGTATNGRDALRQIITKKPDIVFMDIQMPHLLGTEVVEKFTSNGAPFFIFVTAFEDQALKAFELNAVDYLLKPFSDERFFQSLSRAREYVKTARISSKIEVLSQHIMPAKAKYRSQFTIKSGGKITFVRTKDILHLKASGNYVEIVTLEKKHLLRATVNEIERELDPTEFIRIHRAHIVKKSEIKELHSYFNGEYIVLMRNGDQLKLSRSYKKNLADLIS